MKVLQDLLNALGWSPQLQRNPESQTEVLPQKSVVDQKEVKTSVRIQLETVEDLEKMLENEAAFFEIDGAENQLPMKTEQTIKRFTKENKPLIMMYFFYIIQRAVRDELNEIVMFRLGESELLMTFKLSEYESVIEKLQTYFIKTEQYEQVVECKKLVDQLLINKVIDESKN